MSEQFTVLILGYGEMGHAMEFLLKDRSRCLSGKTSSGRF